MDGHRRYADESEPGWYAGQSPYQTPAPIDGQSSTSNPYDSGVHERPSGAFRLPADGAYGTPAPYVTPDPVTSSGSHALPALDSTDTRMPVRGPEYPTIRPGGATSLADAPSAPSSPSSSMLSSSMPTTYGGPSPSPAAEATTLVPPIAATDRARFGAGAARESIYRTRRPVAAVIVAIVTVLLMVPVALLLIQVTFVDDPAVRGIVPAVLLTFGLPLAGAGLYALTAGGSTGRDAWLRAPIVYLPIGLVLLLAAGLAVA